MGRKVDIPEYIKSVLKIYNDAGFEAFIVGGAVRDILLEKIPHDYDIASSATPDEGLEILAQKGLHTIDMSKKHGTIIVMSDGNQVEITTYRIDGEYADSRHPDSVLFTRSIDEDVKRRDFTMNALYIDREGNLVDKVGGESDIANRLIRTCGDPDKRFNEDALRILRALRFSANLGFTIESKTSESILKNYRLIGEISKERIASEFVKLLTGRYASRVIKEYLEVFAFIIPELGVMKGFDQKSKYHDKDLLEHTLAVLDGVMPRSDELCLAALLHDIGKPAVFTVGEDGYGHMHQHNIVSSEIATRFMDEYKFSNAFKKLVTDLIMLHDTFPSTKSSIRKYVSEYSLEFFKELSSLQRADIGAHSEYGKNRISILEERDTILEEIIRDQECLSIKDLKISGSDIIELGIPSGPRVGSILRDVFDKVLEEKIPNESEALLEYVRKLV